MKTQINQIQEQGLHLTQPDIFLIKAREFALQSKDIFYNGVTQLAKNAAKECMLAYRKVEASDCSYSAYVNANAAEQWLATAIKYNDEFYND